MRSPVSDLTLMGREFSASASAGSSEAWFMDWVSKSPRQAAAHMRALKMAYESLHAVYSKKQISSHVEYFGGLGASAMAAQDSFYLRRQTVLDYSPAAALHLEGLFPDARVVQGDSFDPGNYTRASLVGLDFGDLTAWKLWGQNTRPHRGLVERVVEAGPKAIVLTDIAGAYLHVNHSAQQRAMGRPAQTYGEYLDSFALTFEDKYAYRLLAGYTRRWSTVMAFVPVGRTARGGFTHTPDGPPILTLDGKEY